jgi:hypothetical protein
MDLTDFDLTEKEMVYNNKIFKFLKCINQKISGDQIRHPKDHKALAAKNPIFYFFSPYHLKPTIFPPSDFSLSQIYCTPLWHLLPYTYLFCLRPVLFSLALFFRRSSCLSLSDKRFVLFSPRRQLLSLAL